MIRKLWSATSSAIEVYVVYFVFYVAGFGYTCGAVQLKQCHIRVTVHRNKFLCNKTN
jgi:hypothetical protein